MARAIEPFALDMVEGGGILQLRDFEPYELAQPTRISGSIDAGDDGTGAITNGTFSTPTVEAEVEALGLDVFIDAEFTQVSPGNLTGGVDADGELFLQMAVTVNLDIEVENPPIITAPDCVATPVNLVLRSVEDYDPDSGLVTVEDPNFTIPEIQSGQGCTSNLTGPLNEQLAGPGHALRLTLQGDLALPPAGSEDAVATLAVSPEGGSRLGDEVTLTATVEPDESSDEPGPPEGLVDFRDGNQLLATVELTDGEASFVTSDLAAGNRRLNVRYRGDGLFRPTTSATVTYLVAANPTVTSDLPEHVRIGGGPVDFDVTTTNTGLGTALDNARVDVTFQRPAGTGTGVIGPDRIVLEVQDGDTWVEIPLTTTGSGANQTVTGSIPSDLGFPLAPGASHTDRLRLTVQPEGAPAINPGPLRVTTAVVQVDPATGAPEATVASTSGVITLTEATRRASTIAFRLPFQGPPVSPPVARQGTNVTIPVVQVNPAVGGLRATGHVEFRLDGTPIAVSDLFGASTEPPVFQVPLQPSGAVSVSIDLPSDASLGAQEITIRYSGDAVFAPSQTSQTITVVPSVGPSYECNVAFDDFTFRVNVVAHANLPTARPAGTEAVFDAFELSLLAPREQSAPGNTRLMSSLGTGPVEIGSPTFATNVLESISFGFGPGGDGTAAGLSRTGTPMSTPDTVDVDQPIEFLDPTGTVPIEGEPGDVVPVTVDSITFTVRLSTQNLPYVFTCLPVDEPLSLGEVTVAGTTLEVDPVDTVRAGREVTLSARTAPVTSTGVVEFRDGTTTIGVVPVDAEGNASMVTDELPEGTRSLTARSFGGLLVPSTTSTAVDLTVLPAVECAEFTDEGNGAVVRLVYLELLGRCPDAAGFAGWVQRLDGGMSPEAFANTIARTNEALGRVVDDGYDTMLDRAPDAGGRAFWIGRLGGTGRYDQLLADLASSNEFWVAAGSTNNGFVTLVYERILGRAPDPGGLAHWTGQLNAGVPRGTLVSTLARLDEPLGRIVDGSYAQILNRAPFAGERTTAITNLRATGNRSALYAALIGTSEFFDRAQSFPNPED